MIEYIFLFSALSIIIMVATHLWYPHKYTINECFIQGTVTTVVILLTFLIANYINLIDVKYINGYVTDTNSIVKKCDNYNRWSDSSDSWCRHEYTRLISYSCEDSDGKSTTCHKTQYSSVYPWEQRWYVISNIGKWEIQGVDRQGSQTPPRWAEVKLDDPVTSTQTYYNYIKAAPNSIFKPLAPNEAIKPITRNKIYDYYKIDNVYGDKTHVQPDFVENLNKLNSRLTNEANVVILITQQTEYIETWKRMWQGFKINDVSIVLITNPDGTISKAEVFSWSKEDIVNVMLADYFNLSDNPKDVNNLNLYINDIEKIINEKYVKPDPEDFEYLKYDIDMSNMAIIFGILMLLIITPITTYILYKKDFF